MNEPNTQQSEYDEDAFGDTVPDDTTDCTWCGGDGWFIGEEAPGFDYVNDDPNEMYPCTACRGTGLRKNQVCF